MIGTFADARTAANQTTNGLDALQQASRATIRSSIHPSSHPSISKGNARALCVAAQHITTRAHLGCPGRRPKPTHRHAVCPARATQGVARVLPVLRTCAHSEVPSNLEAWKAMDGRQGKVPEPQGYPGTFFMPFLLLPGAKPSAHPPTPTPPHPPPLTGRLRVPTSLPRCNRSHLPASGGLRRRRRLQVGTRPPRPPFSSYRPNGLGAPPLTLPPPQCAP